MAFRLEGSFGSECLKPARDSEGLSVLSPMDSLPGNESPGINPDAIGARDLENDLVGRQTADEVRRSALLHLMNVGVEITQIQKE
jgi:hypothetical protein